MSFLALQKILQLLPERIQSRWQFHSIGNSTAHFSEHLTVTSDHQGKIRNQAEPVLGEGGRSHT